MRLSIKIVSALIATAAISLLIWSGTGPTLATLFGPGFGVVEAQSARPQYTDWSAIEPVTAFNTVANELPNAISHDGLRFYFFRNGDIYVSNRPDRNSDWGAPVALPATINLPPPSVETNAFETTDGHWLYFGSTRSGGLGGSDIWVSWRKNVHDDQGWQPAVNLSAVNTAGFENGPALVENEETGMTELYFAASPCAAAPCPAGTGTQAFADLYMSILGPGGFETPELLASLSDPTHHDGKPWVLRGDRELFFESYRLGPPPMSTGGAIFMSTRPSGDQPWGDPAVTLVGPSNPGSPGDRWLTTPVLSRDALTLYVGVNQTGTDIGDIYEAHREKVTGSR
jgi:hypothetical protein